MADEVRSKKRYGREFRLEASRLVVEGGYTLAEAASRLGSGPLRRRSAPRICRLRSPNSTMRGWSYSAPGCPAGSAVRWAGRTPSSPTPLPPPPASNMKTIRRRETMLWRLLRLESAPYFVLGESADRRPLRYRVATPWDFRIRYEFRDLFVSANREAQQPVVHWKAVVRNHTTDLEETVEGHVEIRWSHGRFGSSPEAKVYLDTSHHEVPGYLPLDEPAPESQPELRLFD